MRRSRSFPADGQWLEKATAIVSAMKSRADRSGDEKAKKQVVVLYRLIAVQLEKQLALMDEPGQLKQFAGNLNRFLDRLPRRIARRQNDYLDRANVDDVG